MGQKDRVTELRREGRRKREGDEMREGGWEVWQEEQRKVGR